MKKNCAFQYAKITGSIFKSTEIVVDKSELTIDEAKKFWNYYFPDLARHIKSGEVGEMVIWINMETPNSYGDMLEYISYDAESDGVQIWETKRVNFTRVFNL